MATRPPSQRAPDGRNASVALGRERELLDDEAGALRFALEAIAIERAVRRSLGLLPSAELS